MPKLVPIPLRYENGCVYARRTLIHLDYFVVFEQKTARFGRVIVSCAVLRFLATACAFNRKSLSKFAVKRDSVLGTIHWFIIW